MKMAHFYNVNELFELLERHFAEYVKFAPPNLPSFIELATLYQSKILVKALIQWREETEDTGNWDELALNNEDFVKLVGVITLDKDKLAINKSAIKEPENIWLYWNES